LNEARPAGTPSTVNASMLRQSDDDGLRVELTTLAVHPVGFTVAGVPVEVRFDVAGAADIYRRRYRHMLSSQAPTLTAYAVTRNPNQTFFWAGEGPLYCWDRSEIPARIIAFFADAVATTAFLNSIDDLVALHAAAITDGRVAAFIAGVSTAGKSTTAIACFRRGLQLYSDEFCLVRAGAVLPHPRAISVRQEGLELLLADVAPASPVDAWLSANRGDDRENVGFDELFGSATWPAPRPLAIAFAAVAKERVPMVRSIAPAQMLAHTKPFARQKPRGLAGVAALLEVLQPVTCYELTLGPPDATAELIARILRAS
jgi:hypothetical protein